MSTIDKRSRMLACWWGKAIGGTLGMPYEGAAGPIVIDLATANLAPVPNDDLELQLIWLHAMEQQGATGLLSTLRDAWLTHQDFHVDEYAIALQNMKAGLEPPLTGYHGNWFENGMGAAIRSELWACLSPGNPQTAAVLAHFDACVDHAGEGLDAEKLLAAIQSLAFDGISIREAMQKALSFIEPSSRFVSLVEWLLDLPARRLIDEDTQSRLLTRVQHHNFTDCFMNVGFTLWALLAGEGDFDRTLTLAIGCGQDTDCTGATAGATLGLFGGMQAIPERWRLSASNRIAVSPSLQMLGLPQTIEELTDRVEQLRDTPSMKGILENLVPPAHVRSSTRDDAVIYHAEVLESTADQAVLQHGAKLRQQGDGIQAVAEHGRGVAMLPVLAQQQVADVVATVSWQLNRPFEGWLMVAAEAGLTVWANGRKVIDYHGRRPVIPAVHRTEGGATIPIQFDKPGPITLTIRLLGCQAHTRLFVQWAHLDRSLVIDDLFQCVGSEVLA